ncbi:hypothetical protein [Streptomyces litchfieldiae]|uniref:Uncharacterized protein n=1 Tax=Streptomyces litchfieldiae TaxID=3075543 RepID=A0ABU2MUQ7_9ACTN|nr:hypothetical protein [Streptomyces sp. DSM 44938]MDT0345381.1 hypothetical protein [Streptomyces sp. DSM 44938]
MRPHAELAQVWPRDGRLRLVGRLHGHLHGTAPAAERPSDWWLLAVAREDEGHRVRRPAPLHGPEFDVSLPVADFVPDGLALPVFWDLYLAPDPGANPGDLLRVGRLLDDIQGKKKIMIFPGQSVTASSGAALVKPYYTIKDNLSVEVKAAR